MEILNVITHEAGTSNIGQIILSIFLSIAVIFFISILILCFIEKEYGCSAVCIIAALIFGFFAVFSWLNTKEDTTWHEYDVRFTEPVNLNEFYDKYEIKSQNGQIFHIEERH